MLKQISSLFLGLFGAVVTTFLLAGKEKFISGADGSFGPAFYVFVISLLVIASLSYLALTGLFRK